MHSPAIRAAVRSARPATAAGAAARARPAAAGASGGEIGDTVKSWTLVALVALFSLLTYPTTAPGQQPSFPTAEDAVRALNEAAKASDLSALIAIFGPGSQELASSSDPATARMNRDVFVTAMAERWHLEDID